jgi:competence protein ComEA
MRTARKVLTAAALAVAVTLGATTGVRAEEGKRVDLNTASVAELTALPGIGAAKAAAIIEHRQREPFRSVDDLTKVKGIGDKMLDQLRDRISVGGEQGESGASRRGS